MLTLDSIRDIQLYQSKSGYRFSVDALLLFSFVNLPRVKKIADVGAGSGIIGLLLAKKYPRACVTLIELQGSLVKLAERNILLNKLEERVTVVNADARTLVGHWSLLADQDLPIAHCPLSPDYNLVVANPPFRRVKTGLISATDEKALARHEISLSLDDLIRASSAILKHHGRLCLVHLPERMADLVAILGDHSLELKRVRFVHSSISSEAKIVLMEAVKGGQAGLKIEKPLFIYNEDGSYTDEMKALYG